MSFFDFTTKKQNTFVIYTMDSLSDDNDTGKDNVALEFTSLMDFEYDNSIRIAYEPIEGGDFTSDAKIESPFTLKINAVYSPFADSKKDTPKSLRQKISNVETKLEEFKNNNKLLVLFNTYPICSVYKNIKLISVNYKRTSENNMLLVNLTFQEIRITGLNYDTLDANTITNPENSPSTDSGVVSPVTSTDSLMVA